MKKVVYLAVFLTICTFVNAAWNMDAEEISVNMDINGGFKIEKESSSASINYVIANLSFIPKSDYRQIVNNLDPQPDNDDYLIFRYDEPMYGYHTFHLKADILTKNNRKRIKSQVPFPIEVSSDLQKYILPSETIDSDNTDIIRLANSLAEGENDLFIVVHKLAEWTQDNIDYNLSTLTYSASKSASWVLDNRYGVCDELTNLFIAMLRSLGIPARFVSGIAYTDSELFDENWGMHGWAEVYFPGYGWVDYDVTYGQFGFIDPTHIKIKDSLDASDTSIHYTWLGKNSYLDADDFKADTILENYNGKYENNIHIEVDSARNIVGFNSYNLITATIINNNNFYVSEEIVLFKIKEMETLDEIQQNIILKPLESKDIYWIVKTKELESGYIYTFPLVIRSLFNNTNEATFLVRETAPVYSEEEMKELIVLENDFRHYSKDILLECETDKDEFYTYEENKITCVVENTGNVFHESLQICFKDNCQSFSLGISQKNNVEFIFTDDVPGIKKTAVKAGKVIDAIEYNVLDIPNFVVGKTSYPEEVGFGDTFVLSFLLDKKSFSSAYDVEITLARDGFKEVWEIDELDNNKNVSLALKGKDLSEGENKMDIMIKYKDKQDKEYNESAEININLKDLTFFQKLYVMFGKLVRKVEGLFQ